MDKEKTISQTEEQNKEQNQTPLSETWAQDALAELDDFIESQGIYIRQ